MYERESVCVRERERERDIERERESERERAREAYFCKTSGYHPFNESNIRVTFMLEMSKVVLVAIQHSKVAGEGSKTAPPSI